MSRYLLIAGEDKYNDLIWNTLRIEQNLTYIMNTCKFQIRHYRPIEGEEIIIEDDFIGRLFAGIIVKVELAKSFPVNQVVKVWQVECNDYTELVDRKLVVEAYENKTADEIFLDIAIKYCSDFNTDNIHPDAPVVESTGIEFEYKRPSECFKWLCDYCGWHWYPDYYKGLHFFSTEELASPAPMILTPGGKFRFGKHSFDSQGLRNRVYVRGGTMLSDPQPMQWKADGIERIWVLPWSPHDIGFKVGEVSKSVGVENLHDEAEFDYMMSFAEKYIRCSEQTATPIAGETMTLTARQDIPVITMVEDFKSQQALAKVQGGDGAYEHIITDDSLVTVAAAEAAGLADLREHANPRVKGDFETEYVKPAVYETVFAGYENVLTGYTNILVGWEIAVDQPTGKAFTGIFSPRGTAQSFEASESLVGADRLKVFLKLNTTSDLPPDTLWDIRKDNNGVPGEPISAQAEILSGSLLPVSPNSSLVGVEIALIEPLEEGEIYWLTFFVLGTAGTSSIVNYYVSTSDVYSGGYRCDSIDGGVWTKFVAYDLIFRIEVPEYEQIPIYEQVPIYEKQLVTEPCIWQPGQLVDIRLPDRGVEGKFLIQRVTVTPVSPKLWTFQIEYGGRLLGIADYLQALVSAQQKKRHLEPAQSVQKFVYSEDKLALRDQLFTALRELPYICGDEDAICGMVIVSGGKTIIGWQEEIIQPSVHDSEELSTLNILQAQGFTATLGMDGVTDLRIHINSGGISTRIDTKWYIYDMNGSIPGSPICTPVIIPAGEWGGWMTIIIRLTESLEAGKKYVIVGQGQAESGNGVWWGYSGGNPYADGVMYESYNNGVSWSTYTTLDYTFKIDSPIYG